MLHISCGLKLISSINGIHWFCVNRTLFDHFRSLCFKFRGGQSCVLFTCIAYKNLRNIPQPHPGMLVRQHQDYEPFLGLGNRNPNLNLPRASGFRRFVPVLQVGRCRWTSTNSRRVFFLGGILRAWKIRKLYPDWWNIGYQGVGNNLRVEQLGTLVETNCIIFV